MNTINKYLYFAVDAEKADAPEEPQISGCRRKDIYDFIEMLNLFKPVKLYNIKNYMKVIYLRDKR